KIIGILTLLAGIFFGYIFYNGYSRGPEISERVTNFLYLASKNDAISAYDFFTEALKNSLLFEAFADDIELHFARVSFEKQEQTGFYFMLGMPGSSKYNILKLRRIYMYDGIITYSRGYEGTVSVVFVREDGQWKIDAFGIPDPYNNTN
ncbi:MAG: hypothetical protein AAB968_02105, partial [Patescibacteria group bacterium]